MSASDYLRARGVVDLVHFTPASNLAGILADGIVPRDVLEEDGKEFTCYDQRRFDGKRHVNLSITHPNVSLFFKFREEAKRLKADAKDHVFAVLTLDPSLLDEYAGQVEFRATNAASNRAMDCSVQELFGGYRTTQKDNETSDNQAEVLDRGHHRPQVHQDHRVPGRWGGTFRGSPAALREYEAPGSPPRPQGGASNPRREIPLGFSHNREGPQLKSTARTSNPGKVGSSSMRRCRERSATSSGPPSSTPSHSPVKR